ncbi:KH domain-containing protein [Camellia lanceoleosa]|uniref:KH domain-containing protein n=1 Tax=Camellia lanceoleosa TaxID=1840588 RepID=A0ACC0HPD2_9ERIC|nr:KH domain-containing protein [Camellia lanceoleosa]
MLFQAYASWNNLSHVDESYRKKDVNSPTYGGGPFIDVRHRRDYYIIHKTNLVQRDKISERMKLLQDLVPVSVNEVSFCKSKIDRIARVAFETIRKRGGLLSRLTFQPFKVLFFVLIQYLALLLAEHQKLEPFVQVVPICSRLLNQAEQLRRQRTNSTWCALWSH